MFDNASFLVTGEEVRVAGAKVGSVTAVDIATADEPVTEDGSPDPGKAIVVMQIDDPAFQDFRTDASCLIRPQSLIGEKFVECTPTEPRAPGNPAPPQLAKIPDGQPGAGQYLLPLERNGKAVDLDLVNNIMREPYPDRFRLILNDLGAGLAARGDELAEIVERANPALRETNKVIAILRSQNRDLADLATDGDQVITALARERESVAGFINSSTTVGQATAERQADLEAGFAKLPGFLRELRSTMGELTKFSDAATPVFSDLGAAAPSLTDLNQDVIPFSNAGIPAVTSLGKAADEAGPAIVASDPVIRQIREPRQRRRSGEQEPAEAARQPAQDERLPVPDEDDLRARRRRQLVRPVRPLPPRADPGPKLLRLHLDPAVRLQRQVRRRDAERRREGEAPRRRPPRPAPLERRGQRPRSKQRGRRSGRDRPAAERAARDDHARGSDDHPRGRLDRGRSLPEPARRGPGRAGLSRRPAAGRAPAPRASCSTS